MSRTLPLAVVLLLSSCASWDPVQHSPRAVTSTNPGEDLMRLVMTARAWRPAKIDLKETFAVFSYVNQYGVQTVTLPYGEVAKIELLSNKGTEWDVEVLDAKGERLYRYLAGDEAKAREFVDVLTAIAKPRSPQLLPAPATQTM
jgi:hypothetical protein